MERIWESCRPLEGAITGWRRDLHRIPEIGEDLPRTQAYVKARLGEIGIPYRTGTKDSSVIAEIEGGMPGRRVAFRADMDALEIEEETGLPFASEHPGRMHACGHDAHTAMLLGAGKVLWENRARLHGSVRLIFQTAEEPVRGARIAIADGCLDGVDAVFGTHIGTLMGTEIPSGTILISRGCCMASGDHFTITVRGAGCHGSSPEKGVDPIHIAAHVLLTIEGIQAREISALEPAVVTVGRIHGGDANNVIPDTVMMGGTIRALDRSMRDRVARRMREIAEGTALALGGSAVMELTQSVPPVVNDPAMADLAARAAREVAGAEKVEGDRKRPCMGSEDFSLYLEEVPGCFMFLSTADPAKGTNVSHHSARFNVDEGVLWEGSAVFAAIAERFLNGEE